MVLDKLHTKLIAAKIDPFELSIINQKNCPNNLTDAYNININDDTISAHAAAEVIRKAGAKIGDGVEYLSGKTKEAYHKYVDKDGKTVTVTPDPNSEWLP